MPSFLSEVTILTHQLDVNKKSSNIQLISKRQKLKTPTTQAVYDATLK